MNAEALISPLLDKALMAVVEAVKSLNLDPKSKTALANASATLPNTPISTAGSIETIDGYQAVVGSITVKGQQFDTLRSKGFFSS